MSEVFDPLVKRMSYRKQKRWWNAFMLFYTRVDYTEDENESLLKEMALLSIGMFWVVLLNLPTLYNAILRIARNFLETRENIKISTHPFYHINLG